MTNLDQLRALRRHAERQIRRSDALLEQRPYSGTLVIVRRWWARIAYRAQAHIERLEAEL